jgi:hypothetical protein
MIRVSQSCCILGLDLLSIAPPSFSRVLFSHRFSEKSSKIKFLEKFQKNLFKFLCQKWGREVPRRPQGDLPRHLTTRGRGPAQAAPTCCVEGPPGLSLISSSPALSLSWKQWHTCSNSCSCCSPSRFFDLLSQPIIVAEIWSICSPVCDSSDCPSRILFSGVFIEYFSSIGDRWNKFACLFYCLKMLFWCMLAL